MSWQPNYRNNASYKSRNNFRYTSFIQYNPLCRIRSFDELVQERTYLLNSLQREDFSAMSLMKHISSARESLVKTLDQRARRRVRNHIIWLQNRLEETAQQEKSILSRLGQVSYEIQHIERYNRVEEERLAQALEFGGQAVNVLPATPHFVPQNEPYHYFNQYWDANESLPAYACTSEPLPDDRSLLNQREECNVTPDRNRSSSSTNMESKFHKERRLDAPVVSSEWSIRYQGAKNVQYVGHSVDKWA